MTTTHEPAQADDNLETPSFLVRTETPVATQQQEPAPSDARAETPPRVGDVESPRGLPTEKRPLRLPRRMMDEDQAAAYVGLQYGVAKEWRAKFLALNIQPTKVVAGSGRRPKRTLWSAEDILNGLPHDWPHNILPAPAELDSDQTDLQIHVGDIEIPEGRRNVDPGKVSWLAESMQFQGLSQPILVRVIRIDEDDLGYNEQYVLIAGAHRLAAAKLLGWGTIDATKVVTDDTTAMLMEIDENLVRAELTPAEHANHIARRKEIFERVHGSAKAKGAAAAHEAMGHQHDANAKLADAFTTNTAKATGMSERAVQRDVQRAKAIGTESLTKIAGTSLDKGAELDALAKLPEDKRAELIEQAAGGEKVSAQAAAKKSKATARKVGREQMAEMIERQTIGLAAIAAREERRQKLSAEAARIEKEQLDNVLANADFGADVVVESPAIVMTDAGPAPMPAASDDVDSPLDVLCAEWARSNLKSRFDALEPADQVAFLAYLKNAISYN